MFIELAEFLRCPACRSEVAALIVAPDAMRDRTVRTGRVGCSGCRREYEIRGGVVRFGGPPPTPPDVALPPAATAEGIRTLLGVSGPGGYVLLVGAASRLGTGLAEVLPGVHWVAVNPPDASESSRSMSVLQSAAGIPLKSGVVRGAVVGPDYARPDWLAEAARVVLRGLRVAAFGPSVPVDGVELMASSVEAWVGERR